MTRQGDKPWARAALVLAFLCLPGWAAAQVADLTVSVTDGSATAIPGNPITYTISLGNLGPNDAANAPVADTFPATLTGVSWTCVATFGSSCTAAAGVGNINSSVSLLAGGSATYTVNATVASTATGSLSNTATITPPGGTFDPTLPNSSTDTDALPPQVDLTILKNDGQANEVPGTSVTYSIAVGNNGPSRALNATVTDTFLPTLTGVTWTCSATAGSLCTAAGAGNISDTVTVASGGTLTYTVIATVAPSATGLLTNTATVAAPAGTGETAPGNNSSTDTDTLTPQANLGISKTDSQATDVPGTSITYTISVTNIGPSNAPGSLVSDTFPAALSAITWTCLASVGSSCTAAGAGNISDTVSILSGGTLSYTVNATISASATGILSNTATVAVGAGVTDPVPGNNSSTDTTTMTPQADLTVTKTDGVASATPGTAISYTITVGNAGPSNAPSSLVTDTFPAALTGVTWTCTPSAGSSCTGVGAGNINDTTTILVGGTLTYTVNADIDPCATGTLSNTASVATGGGVTDPGPNANSSTDSDSLVPSADLEFVEKVDSEDPILVCNYETYDMEIQNNGPSCATNVTLTDPLPADMNFLSSMPTSPTCINALNTVTCNLGTLNPGDFETVEIVAIPGFSLKGTQVLNTASVTASTGDPDPSNNSGSQTTDIKPSEPVVLTKTGAPRYLRQGVSTGIAYDVKFTSLCVPEVTHTNVNITDTMPSDLIFVDSVPAPTSQVGNVLTYSYPAISGGSIEQITIQAALPLTVAAGTTLTNSAVVVDDAGNTDSDSFAGGVRAGSRDEGKLKLTFKSAPQVTAGGNLNSRVVIDNTSGVPSTNATLILDSPASIGFVLASPAPTSVQTVGGIIRLTWTFASIKRKQTIRLNQTVSSTVAADTILTRTAAVSDDLARAAIASRDVLVRGEPTVTPTGVVAVATSTPSNTPIGPTRTPTPSPTQTATPAPLSGQLSLSINAPNSVLAGSRINSTVLVDGTATEIPDVTVTLSFPETLALESSTPTVASIQSSDGNTVATWSVGTVGGAVARAQIQLRLSVPGSIASGTQLDLAATASAPTHITVTASESVEVHD